MKKYYGGQTTKELQKSDSKGSIYDTLLCRSSIQGFNTNQSLLDNNSSAYKTENNLKLPESSDNFDFSLNKPSQSNFYKKRYAREENKFVFENRKAQKPEDAARHMNSDYASQIDSRWVVRKSNNSPNSIDRYPAHSSEKPLEVNKNGKIRRNRNTRVANQGAAQYMNRPISNLYSKERNYKPK